MELVRITSSYPKFNGSHSGLPPIHRMTGTGWRTRVIYDVFAQAPLLFFFLPLGHDVCFLCFSSNFFLKINAGARKKQTNHQKINTVLHRGNAKCDGQEAFARGTIDGTIDEKQLISNRPTSCSAAKTKQNKGRPLEQISFAAFSRLLSLSPDRGSERALTDMANKHAQESDRAMVGPPAPSSLSRSTFCPQQLSHT